MTNIIELLESNGARLSSSMVGEIISQYSLSQQEGNTILQVNSYISIY